MQPIKKIISPKDRKVVAGIIAGKLDPTRPKYQKILAKPEVAITFEIILDQAGLNDKSLSAKIGEIVKRRATRTIDASSGKTTTNQTSVDSNVIAAAKMIWQMQGKFTEKTEVHHSGSIQKMSEESLDKLILGDTTILGNRIKQYDKDEDAPSTWTYKRTERATRPSSRREEEAYKRELY